MNIFFLSQLLDVHFVSLTFAGQTEYKDCVHFNFDKITAGVSIGIRSLSFLGMIVWQR